MTGRMDSLYIADGDGDELRIDDEGSYLDFCKGSEIVNVSREEARNLRDYLNEWLCEKTQCVKEQPSAGTITVKVEPDLTGFRGAIEAEVRGLAVLTATPYTINNYYGPDAGRV